MCRYVAVILLECMKVYTWVMDVNKSDIVIGLLFVCVTHLENWLTV